ncbi:MAG: hypothetical protein C4520_10030 [Candidatus Abyssobacteria bacterium SURF_5]|uniref:DUF4352 domain-containing protein n=1 Tax=Abyssobacteria bacterium (strain SURF_5) TaxID=2093360 RepID=A0A3A4NKZ0_ABYX5|nr:MAG: hypothetical protein C4520_10030 [Candidatus Abyssubacteria bacterium SURF_5]
MRTKLIIVVVSVSVCFALMPQKAAGDLIKFRHGAKKQCVVLEETEDWVVFLTAYGEMKMPMSRIESIERESEETNKSLKEQWNRQPKTQKEEPEKQETVKEEKPQVKRTYKVEAKRRRVMVGARSSGLSSKELESSFTIKDMGMVQGSRLFHVSVMSYKNASIRISPPDFYAFSVNNMRINPHPLDGYPDLDAKVSFNQSASGHISFPTAVKIEKLVHKSELAEFELNLETGEAVAKETGL